MPLTGHHPRITSWRVYFASFPRDTVTLIPRGEAMQAFGSLLFMWGGLDWFMSSQEVDVYYDWFGIYLPDAIYNYSHWIAMGVGSMLVAAGNQSK